MKFETLVILLNSIDCNEDFDNSSANPRALLTFIETEKNLVIVTPIISIIMRKYEVIKDKHRKNHSNDSIIFQNTDIIHLESPKFYDLTDKKLNHSKYFLKIFGLFNVIHHYNNRKIKFPNFLHFIMNINSHKADILAIKPIFKNLEHFFRKNT